MNLRHDSTYTQEEAMMAAGCGHSFSKASITTWLRQNHAVCPVCKSSLTEAQLVPNYALRSAIERYAMRSRPLTSSLLGLTNFLLATCVCAVIKASVDTLSARATAYPRSTQPTTKTVRTYSHTLHTLSGRTRSCANLRCFTRHHRRRLLWAA